MCRHQLPRPWLDETYAKSAYAMHLGKSNLGRRNDRPQLWSAKPCEGRRGRPRARRGRRVGST